MGCAYYYYNKLVACIHITACEVAVCTDVLIGVPVSGRCGLMWGVWCVCVYTCACVHVCMYVCMYVCVCARVCVATRHWQQPTTVATSFQ